MARFLFPAPRFWLIIAAHPSWKPFCALVVKPLILLEIPSAPTVKEPYILLIEFTTTFPKEKALFSTITGKEIWNIGPIVSHWKEIFLKEKEKKLSFLVIW